MNEYTEPMAWQHWRANNDVNGNPRRCYVVYAQTGHILDVIDEGYAGKPRWLNDLPQLATVDVSVTQYRQILTFAASQASS